MNTRIVWTAAASVLVVGLWATVLAEAQSSRPDEWARRTSWGDPDLQGEWTSEGEFGVPFERPARIRSSCSSSPTRNTRSGWPTCSQRDERDLKSVDVLAGQSRCAERTDPALARIRDRLATHFAHDRSAEGRLPPRTPQAAPLPVERCGSLQRGEPCDSYKDYGLGVRCIVHGGGFPDAMFPAVYNANFRDRSGSGGRCDHLRADSRHACHSDRLVAASARRRMFAGDPGVHGRRARPLGRYDARGRNEQPQGRDARRVAGAAADRAVHARVRRDLIRYQVTFVDPGTWTAPWTAALDLKARPDGRRSVRVRVPRGQLWHAQHAVHGALPRANGPLRVRRAQVRSAR